MTDSAAPRRSFESPSKVGPVDDSEDEGNVCAWPTFVGRISRTEIKFPISRHFNGVQRLQLLYWDCAFGRVRVNGPVTGDST
jgi:hypothetical protein